jgi:hypothetical protein
VTVAGRESPPDPASPGTCYGFAVHSSLAFHYLRGGEGTPLTIVAPSEAGVGAAQRPVLEWVPRPEHPFHARLYHDGPRFRLWIGSLGWYTIDPKAGRIALPETDQVVLREERLWGIPVALCMLARGDLPIHAAAVEVGGSAVIFAAPGRHGKTTLAAAFSQAGHRVLSEDLTCLRTLPAPAVIPGPALLRVRRDMLGHLAPHGARPVAENDDRTSLALGEAGRGDCRPVPVRAVVLLRMAEAGVRMERLGRTDALADLWALSFRTPDDAGRTQCFTAIADLIRRIPVWNLHRPMRVDDLAPTVDRIVSTCLA